MNELELAYTLFIAGAPIPELVEGLDINSDGPYLHYMKDPTGRYISVSIMHSSGKNYFAFVDKPTDIEEVNKSAVALIQSSIKNGKAQRFHICESIEGTNSKEVIASLSKVFKKDLSEVLDWDRMEINKAIQELKDKYGSDALLRDEAMSEVYCASPLQRCNHCGKFVEYGHLQLAKLPKIDPVTSKLIETEDGDISYNDVMACDDCHSSLTYEDIPIGQMHTFKVPITKSETSFERWPFQRTMGIELEGLMVAPINFKKLKDELNWNVVTDSSIKTPKGRSWKPLEFNSRPACGDAFFDIVTKGLGLISDRMRVNASCGFHVHIGWEDLDRGQKANVQNLLFGFENLLFAMQPPSRQENHYCKRWLSTNPGISSKPESLLESGEKYMGINYSHAAAARLNGDPERTGNYGTIEFRMGAGTRNPIKVLMWCEFIHRLVDIGSELYSKDNYVSLRSMRVEELFAIFKDLATKYDVIHERPTEYLTELCVWMEERLTKFSGKVDHVKVPVLDTNSKVVKFSNAKKPSIENVEERYEDKYKTTETIKSEYLH